MGRDVTYGCVDPVTVGIFLSGASLALGLWNVSRERRRSKEEAKIRLEVTTWHRDRGEDVYCRITNYGTRAAIVTAIYYTNTLPGLVSDERPLKRWQATIKTPDVLPLRIGQDDTILFVLEADLDVEKEYPNFCTMVVESRGGEFFTGSVARYPAYPWEPMPP